MDAPVTELDARFSAEGVEATPWAAAEEILEGAQLSWVTTVRADGRPHVTPLVAVWLDGAVHFSTGPSEQKAVNLAANPEVAMTTGCWQYEVVAAASAGGDLRELMAILDPDVAGDARLVDGPLLSHAEGRAEVASRLLGLFGADAGTTMLPIDLGDHAGVIILHRDTFVAVSRLEARGDRICLIQTFVLRRR